MSGAKGTGFNMGISGNGDLPAIIVGIMKEMSKFNKIINKRDIYTTLQGKYDESTFEKALQRLENDGTIYSGYDTNVYSLNEDQ